MLYGNFYAEKHAKYCDAQNLSTDFALVKNGLSDEEQHVHQNFRYVFSFLNEIELILNLLSQELLEIIKITLY